MKRKADTQLTPNDLDLNNVPPNSFSKASEDDLTSRKMVQIKKHEEEEITNFFFDEDSDIVLDDDYEMRKKNKASPSQDVLSSEQSDVLMGDQTVNTVTTDVLDDVSTSIDIVTGDKPTEPAALVSASDLASTNTTEKQIEEPTPTTQNSETKLVTPSTQHESENSDISTPSKTTTPPQPTFGRANFGTIKTPGKPKSESFGSFAIEPQQNENDEMPGTKDKPVFGVPPFKPADLAAKPFVPEATADVSSNNTEVSATEKKTFSFTTSDKKSSFSLKSSFGSNAQAPVLALNPGFSSEKAALPKSNFGDKPAFPQVSFGSSGSKSGFGTFGSQEKGKAENTATLSAGTPKAVFGTVTTPTTGSPGFKAGFGLGAKTSSFGNFKPTGFGDIKSGSGDSKSTIGKQSSFGGFGNADTGSSFQSFSSLGNSTDSSFFSNNSNEVTKDDDTTITPVLGSENIAPLLKKPDVISNGEEGEEILIESVAKLYRFTDKWEHVAKGKITINKSIAENKYRFILRSDGDFKLKLNAFLFAEMNPTISEGTKVSFIAKNLCTPEEELSSLVLRFQSPETTDNFFNVFTKSIQSL